MTGEPRREISHELAERPRQRLPSSCRAAGPGTHAGQDALACGMDYFTHRSASSFEEQVLGLQSYTRT